MKIDFRFALHIVFAFAAFVNTAWSSFDNSASPTRERSYVWEPNDRIKSIVDSQFGTRDFGYDELGNLIRKEVQRPGSTDKQIWVYQWNALGQLVRVSRPDGREVKFAYDPLGRRIRKTFGKRITHWVLDGNVPLHEWVVVKGKDTVAGKSPQPSGPAMVASDKLLSGLLSSQPSQGPPLEEAEQGTEKAPITWLFEPESFAPMAKLVGERKYSILTDHLGTPYVMADAEGKEVWSADIDVYGARQGGTGHAQACPFRFPGQYEDEETGLYYNRFRYYDPEAGNYVSQDPIGLLGGLRPYGYVGNTLKSIDPYGLSGCADVSTKRNTAFFWSGRTEGVGGQDIAREIAEARGGTTLEKLLDDRKITMPKWDSKNPNINKRYSLDR